MSNIIFQDDSRVQTLNRRIMSRNVPDIHMQTYFDPRPQTTKYHRFPLLHRNYKQKLYPIIKQPDFQPRLHFNPGSYSPFEGHSTNIDTDSRVKNLFMSNQKYTNQNYFIPSSESDLYYNEMDHIGKNVSDNIKQHPYLKDTILFSAFNPDEYNFNKSIIFEGHTRQKTKNLKM